MALKDLSAAGLVDRRVLDGVVNGLADAVGDTGRALRTAQTGRVQNYGLVLFGGLAVIGLVLVVGPLVRP